MLTSLQGGPFAKCLAVEATWSPAPPLAPLFLANPRSRDPPPYPTPPAHPASEQEDPELPPSFLGWGGAGASSESGGLVDTCPEEDGGWGWSLYNLMGSSGVFQPGSPAPDSSLPSLQFLPPKKESAREKRGLRSPGVTTASPALCQLG